LKDVSFSLHRGEILGLYGLMGAGCEEVLQCIFGARIFRSGEILIDGAPVKISEPRDAVKAGIAYVPSERKTEGLVLSQSVRRNISLCSIDKYRKRFTMDTEAEDREAQKWSDRLRVKTADADTEVRTLSGGNQQKVVLAKWMMTQPRVLMLNEPTKGIDVGAKVEIYSMLGEFCKQGIGVLFLSSEMAESMYTADRLLVFHEGRITGEYKKESVTQEDIMRSAIGE
jgi:ribose transport system ATP-binding protein